MRTYKRLFALLVACALVFTLLPTPAFARSQGAAASHGGPVTRRESQPVDEVINATTDTWFKMSAPTENVATFQYSPATYPDRLLVPIFVEDLSPTGMNNGCTGFQGTISWNPEYLEYANYFSTSGKEYDADFESWSYVEYTMNPDNTAGTLLFAGANDVGITLGAYDSSRNIFIRNYIDNLGETDPKPIMFIYFKVKTLGFEQDKIDINLSVEGLTGTTPFVVAYLNDLDKVDQAKPVYDSYERDSVLELISGAIIIQEPASSVATLNTLACSVDGGPYGVVTGFTADSDPIATGYTVGLLCTTAANASITLSGTNTDAAATNDGPKTFNLVNGQGSASITVTAEDEVTQNTYTVSFYTLNHEWLSWQPVDNYSASNAKHKRVCFYSSSHTEGPVDCTDFTEVVTTAPTHTEAGVKTYTCNDCHGSYTEVIAATGHAWGDWEYDGAEVKTHTRTCSCGETETNDCTFDEGVVTTAPTHTEAGVKTYTCTVCGGSYTEVIAAAGHDWGEGVITTAATCSAEGVMTYTCTVCGDTYTEVIPINPDAHVWNDGVVTTPATCSATGQRTYTCTLDPSHTKNEVIPINPDAHVWNDGVVTTPATCTATGVKTFTCTLDPSHTKTEVIAIDPDAHVWGEGVVTTAATCTAKGVMTYTCTLNSSHTYTEDIAIDPDAHSWGDWYANGAAGHIRYCSHNQEEHFETGVHTYEIYSVAVTLPTCTETGLETQKCDDCPYERSETIAALGHSWNDGVVTTPATCSATGVRTYTCTRDSSHTKTETIPIDSTAHSYTLCIDDGNGSTHTWRCLYNNEHKGQTVAHTPSGDVTIKPGYFSHEVKSKCSQCTGYLLATTSAQVSVDNVGAQAKTDGSAIRFNARLNFEYMQNTFAAGDNVVISFLVNVKSNFTGTFANEYMINSHLGDLGAMPGMKEVKLAEFTWKEDYETCTVEQFVTAIRAEGVKVFNYTPSFVFFVLAITGMNGHEDMEIMFQPCIYTVDDEDIMIPFTPGDYTHSYAVTNNQLYNSIDRILAAYNDDIPDGSSRIYPVAP